MHRRLALSLLALLSLACAGFGTKTEPDTDRPAQAAEEEDDVAALEDLSPEEIAELDPDGDGVVDVLPSAVDEVAHDDTDEPAPVVHAKGKKGKGGKGKGKGGKGKGGKGGKLKGAGAAGGAATVAKSPENNTRGGIKYIGDNTWLVKDSKVARIKEEPGRLGAAEIRKDGVHLVRVGTKRDGAYLGLKDGDVVVEANGHSLRGPAACTLTWAKVRNGDRLNLKIRRGEDVVVNKYRVVGHAVH